MESPEYCCLTIIVGIPCLDYCFENRFCRRFPAFRMVYLWGICTGIWILSDSGGDGTEKESLYNRKNCSLF